MDRRRNRRHSPTRAGLPTCRKCNTVSVLDPCRNCAPAEVLATYPQDPKEQQMSRIDDQEHARIDLNPDAWEEPLTPDERDSLDGHEAQDAQYDAELGEHDEVGPRESPPARIRRMMRPTSSGLPREDER